MPWTHANNLAVMLSDILAQLQAKQQKAIIRKVAVRKSRVKEKAKGKAADPNPLWDN